VDTTNHKPLRTFERAEIADCYLYAMELIQELNMELIQELNYEDTNGGVNPESIVGNQNETMVALDRWISPPFGNIPASGGTLHFAVSPDERHRVTDYHPPLSAYWIRDVSFNRNTGILSVAVYPNPNPDPNSERSTNISVWFGMHLRSVRVVQRGGASVVVRFEFPEVFGGGTRTYSKVPGTPLGNAVPQDIFYYGLFHNVIIDRHYNAARPDAGSIKDYRGAVGWVVDDTRVTADTVFHRDTTVTVGWTNPDYHLHFWWPYTDIPLDVRAVTGHDWALYIWHGMQNWSNDPNNYIRVYADHGADNVVHIWPERSDDHPLLLAQVGGRHTQGTRLLGFTIRFYEPSIKGDDRFDGDERFLYNAALFIAGLMAHEIGHVVGLRDGEDAMCPFGNVNSIGGHSNASIMNQGADFSGVRTQGTGIQGPTTIDNRNVNWINPTRRER